MLAFELGASAIGFIFHPGSPRCIRAEDAAAIAERLPAQLARIGVFVNPDPQTLCLTIELPRLTHVQLSGNETPWLCRRAPVPVIKSVRPLKRSAMNALHSFPAAALLVDGERSGLYGGTGTTGDWDFCRELRAHGPTVLAGGLSAENITTAVASAMPDAVDLCSSVEQAPRFKDPAKLKEFFSSLRSIDDSHSRMRSGFLALS